MTRSSSRASASMTSCPDTGSRPPSTCPAHATGCLAFHMRTSPRWECAPGPAPHQSQSRQYASLCLHSKPGLAQLEISYHRYPAPASTASAISYFAASSSSSGSGSSPRRTRAHILVPSSITSAYALR